MKPIVLGNKRRGDTGEYIGRGSPLGNPFRVGVHGSREDVICMYADWLESQMMANNPKIMDELERLATKYKEEGELTLLCWCEPLACHGSIIAGMLYAMVSTIEQSSTASSRG